ncbi:MAG: P-loop NTPase fold protein [Hyphomonadaceae bacterium]
MSASGHLWPKDVLGRDKLAERLTSIVRSHKSGAAISIQGQFGSGKTYFLTNLERHLRDQGIATVYFNAWESDFSDNPLLVLIGDIIAELEHHVPPASVEKLKKSARQLLPVIARVAAKSLLRAGDDEWDKLLGPLDEEVGTLVSDGRRSSVFGRRQLLVARDALTSIVKEAQAMNAAAFPLVVLVDELDRSNPDWIITFLESVKHLFGHQSIVFLIAIDRESVDILIKHRFGAEYDVAGYLSKFFNYAIDIQTPVGDAAFLKAALDASGLVTDGIFENGGDLHVSLTGAANGCIFGLGGPSGKLRRLERCAEKIDVCARAAGKGVSSTVLGFLVGLSETNRKLMREYANGIRAQGTIDAIKLLAQKDDDQWLVDWTVACGISRYDWEQRKTVVRTALGVDREPQVQQMLMGHMMMHTPSSESLASVTMEKIGWLL